MIGVEWVLGVFLFFLRLPKWFRCNWYVTSTLGFPSMKRCYIKWPHCLCRTWIHQDLWQLTYFNSVNRLSSSQVCYVVFTLSLVFPILSVGMILTLLLLRSPSWFQIILFLKNFNCFLLSTWTAFITDLKMTLAMHLCISLRFNCCWV